MKKKYTREPFNGHEQTKINKMIENGTALEGAIKTRYALRRKKRVEQVTEDVTITF